MTISNQNKRIAYAGDDASLTFAYNFRILDEDSLTVVLQSSAGVDTVQVKTTDYSVTGVGAELGGDVVMVTAPATGETLSVILDPDTTQLTDYSTGGTFPAESHENALDKLTNLAKRTRDIVDRSLSLQDGDIDGSGTYDANSNRIKDLADAVNDQDAVTKAGLNAAIANAQVTPYAGVISNYMGTLLDDDNSIVARSTLGAGVNGSLLFTSPNGSTSLGYLGVTAYIQTLLNDSDASEARSTLGVPAVVPRVNYIDNSDFQVWQWGKTFNSTTPYAGGNNDDVYLADQWKLLSDGNDIVDALGVFTNDVPVGAKNSILLTQQTADTKWGLWQVIENAKSEFFQGAEVTLSVWIKAPVGAEFKLLAAEWLSTGDDITTSDPISAWEAAQTKPTLDTNWQWIGGAETSPVMAGGGWERFSVTFTMPASPNNIGIMLCLDSAIFGATSQVRISGFKLELGDTATTYESKEFVTELAQCQRFYHDTFDHIVYPVENVGSDVGGLMNRAFDTGGSRYNSLHWQFPQEMITTPTIVTYNPRQANANWRDLGDTSDRVVAVAGTDTKGAHVGSTSGVTADDVYHIHASADARL